MLRHRLCVCWGHVSVVVCIMFSWSNKSLHAGKKKKENEKWDGQFPPIAGQMLEQKRMQLQCQSGKMLVICC